MQYGDLISVVIPCYNRARSIERAVQGVLLQSYSNIELIVVDDASTDASPAIVESIGDPRLRLIRHDTNQGAAAARNTGVAAATGALIAFQDSDDNWLPDKLDVQMRLLMSLPQNYVAVFCPEIIYGCDGTGRKKRYGTRRSRCVPGPELDLSKSDLRSMFERENIATLQSMLIRKSAFDSVGRFDERLRNNEDWDFNIRLSAAGPIGFDETALVVVYNSSDGISKNARASLHSFVRIFSKLRNTSTDPSILAGHSKAVARRLLRFDRPRAARRYMEWAIRHEGLTVSDLFFYVATMVPTAFRKAQRLRQRPGAT